MSTMKGENNESRDSYMSRASDYILIQHNRHVESQGALKGIKKKQLSPKELIYRQSERVDTVYIVLNGIVKLLTYLPNGKARIVRLHSRNHWLGLEGLVGQPYKHYAVAVDEVEVIQISLDNIHRLERENPGQYFQLLKQGYLDLAKADRWIADFSTGGIKPRVARLVEFLSTIEFGESSTRVVLLTVHEMAEILGVTPESVSRVLAEFKRNAILLKLRSYAGETYQINSLKLQYEARK